MKTLMTIFLTLAATLGIGYVLAINGYIQISGGQIAIQIGGHHNKIEQNNEPQQTVIPPPQPTPSLVPASQATPTPAPSKEEVKDETAQAETKTSPRIKSQPEESEPTLASVNRLTRTRSKQAHAQRYRQPQYEPTEVDYDEPPVKSRRQECPMPEVGSIIERNGRRYLVERRAGNTLYISKLPENQGLTFN